MKMIRRIIKIVMSFVLILAMCFPVTVSAESTVVSSDAAVKYGKYIYYVDQASKNPYRMNENGTKYTKLSDDQVDGDLFIRDNYIYYGTNYQKTNDKVYAKIRRMKLDGTKGTTLIAMTAYGAYINQIYGNYIYFTKNYLKEGKRLCRVSLDGKDDKTLVKGAYGTQIYKNKVYYQTYYGMGPDLGDLYVMDKDGTNKRALMKNVTEFNVYKDKIYYSTAKPDNNGNYLTTFRSMDSNGGSPKVIKGLNSIDIMEINGDKMYYTAGSKLYYISGASGKIHTISELKGYISYNSFRIRGNSLLYVDSVKDSNKLCRANISTGKQEILYEAQGELSYVDYTDGKVFFAHRDITTNKITNKYWDDADQVVYMIGKK